MEISYLDTNMVLAAEDACASVDKLPLFNFIVKSNGHKEEFCQSFCLGALFSGFVFGGLGLAPG